MLVLRAKAKIVGKALEKKEVRDGIFQAILRMFFWFRCLAPKNITRPSVEEITAPAEKCRFSSQNPDGKRVSRILMGTEFRASFGLSNMRGMLAANGVRAHRPTCFFSPRANESLVYMKTIID